MGDEAVRRLAPLARKIAPQHDQMVATYKWLDTLAELTTEHRLKNAALPDRVRHRLEAIPFAYLRVGAELNAHESSYVERHGDSGGWAQLRAIVDWAFLINNWLLLEKESADQREVVRAIRSLAPAGMLLTPDQVRALGKRADTSDG